MCPKTPIRSDQNRWASYSVAMRRGPNGPVLTAGPSSFAPTSLLGVDAGAAISVGPIRWRCPDGRRPPSSGMTKQDGVG